MSQGPPASAKFDPSRTHRGALFRRKMRRYRGKIFLFAALFLGGVAFFARSSDEVIVAQVRAREEVIVQEEPTGGAPVDVGLAQTDDSTVRYQVSEGDIPADIFLEYGGYDANDVAALLASASDIYDFTRMRVGKEVVFSFDGEDSRAREVRYEPDGSRMIVAVRDNDDFLVTEQSIEYEIVPEVAEVTIENSLYQDALRDGLSEATIIGVGEVFSYSLDFASEVRKGDTLKVLYEKRLRDGVPTKDGKVLAAVFTASGEKNFAYYFETSDRDSDVVDFGYYDDEARVLERQFLKAPMDFFRITSGYTGKRFHPILKKNTAHYQIDYAAPSGTPTYSTAHGTVVSARFEKGWGNIVRIKHSGGYTTHYAHLSAFARGMVPGKRVEQGQTIGFVGSTGWSTGPHLDYGMRLNGNPVNPLTLDLPKGAPIADSQRKSFDDQKSQYDSLLGL